MCTLANASIMLSYTRQYFESPSLRNFAACLHFVTSYPISLIFVFNSSNIGFLFMGDFCILCRVSRSQTSLKTILLFV